MENININDANGRFSGGEYDSVIINGVAKCDGDVCCKTMEINGVLKTGSVHTEALRDNGVFKSHGSVVAESTEVNGTMSIEGGIQTNGLDVNGNLSVNGDLSAGDTEVSGRLHCSGTASVGHFDCDGLMQVEGCFAAKTIQANGMLKVRGNIEAESIHTDGHISSEAQISADKIVLNGLVKADEIVGDEIEISFSSPANLAAGILNKLFRSNLQNETKCANLIEATTIRLEGVCAGVVSGENVTIGENCRIDRLDCTGTYTIDPTSTIRILNGEPYMS